MTRNPYRFAVIALVFASLLLPCLAGCGSDVPPPPKMTEEQRQERIREDAERVMKERRESATPRKKP